MNRRHMLRLLAVGSLGLAGWGCRPSSGNPVAVAPVPEARRPSPVTGRSGPDPDEAWDVLPDEAEVRPPRPTDEPTAAPEPAAVNEPAAVDEPAASASTESSPSEPAASGSQDPAEPTSEPSPSTDDGPTESSTPELTPAHLVLICRDDWGARPAGDGMRSHTIQRLMVHHSGFIAHSGQGPEAMREYQDLHMDDRGWADIAYHVGVDRDGHVYELRRWDRAGDTATPYDPAGHFLLLLDGNFQRQQPTDAQFDAAARVLAWASGHFGVSLDTITGHRDHVVTACPGDGLYRRLGELAERAADHARAGVELRRTC